MPGPGKFVCWKCGTEYGPDVVICVRCGVNLKTGDEITAGSDEERPRGAWKVLAFVDHWMPGLLRPVIILLSLLVALMIHSAGS